MFKYQLMLHVTNPREVLGSFHKTKEEAYEYLISKINNSWVSPEKTLNIKFVELKEVK